MAGNLGAGLSPTFLPRHSSTMAPALSRRVGHHGQLVLSGIRDSLEPDVVRAYRDVGMRSVDVKLRDGWVALYPARVLVMVPRYDC